MAIAFDTSTSTNWTTNATTKTVSIASMATGAACFMFIALYDAPETVTLSGWTSIAAGTDGNNGSYAVLYRIKVAGDTTFAPSWGTTTAGLIMVLSYTGTTVVPYEAAVTKDESTSASTWTSTASTPLGSNRWALMFVEENNGSTSVNAWASSAGITERLEVNNNNSGSVTHKVSGQVADTNGVDVTVASHTYSATNSGGGRSGESVLFFIVPSDDVPLGMLPVGF